MASEPALEPAAAGAPSTPKKAHWLLFCTLAAVIVAADLWTKAWVFERLGITLAETPDGRLVPMRHAPIVIVPGLFELEGSINFGAFNGWFGEHTAWLSVISFAAVFVIAGFLYSHLRRPPPHRYWFTAALGLLCGGTLGNFYDRAVLGFVRDFIKWFVVIDGQEHVWPNFNIADSAICGGVGVLLTLMFLDSKRGRVNSPASTPPCH